jgi:tight adherence protein B
MSTIKLIIQSLVIISCLGLIFWFLRELKVLKYQRRFAKFSLTSIEDQEKSFFDLLVKKVWWLTHQLSKILSKSQVLQVLSDSYERHISYEEKNQKKKMDYLSLKFLTSFSFLVLLILSLSFTSAHINLIHFLSAVLIGFFVPDIFLFIKMQKKQKRIEEDLLKAIIIMNNSFKSGRNIMQAVEIVKNELDGPISDEFKKIHMDMTYGLRLEVVFKRFYERVKLEDAKYITSSLTLLNRTGGNIVHVFSSIEKSFYNKKKLQNEMKSLTASSVFVFRVLVVLPILFSLSIFLLNPTYFHPFFETPFGFLSLVLIILLYLGYILTIKKVLKVSLK